MNLKYFFFAIIFTLLLLNVVVLYRFKKSSDDNEKAVLLVERLRERVSDQQEIVERNEKLEAYELVSGDCTVNLDSTLKVFNIKDDHLLVYRFYSNSCHSCIDSMMLIINNFPEKLRTNVLVLSDYKEERQLYTRLHEAGLDRLKFKIIDKLPLPLDSKKVPYLFILDKSRIVHLPFIPDVKNKTRTLKYLNYISKKYWNCNIF